MRSNSRFTIYQIALSLRGFSKNLKTEHETGVCIRLRLGKDRPVIEQAAERAVAMTPILYLAD
jgi:hypothetical protein